MATVKTFKDRNVAVVGLIPDEPRAEALPVLFVPGAWGGKHQFEGWMQSCAARGITSFALDLPGHHESIADVGGISFFGFVSDVKAALGRVCINSSARQCHLVGHSFGGLIAQAIGGTSSFVDKAVLVASAAPAGILPNPRVLIKMPRYLSKMLFWKPFLPTKADAEKLLFNELADPTAYSKLVPFSGKAAAELAFWRIWLRPMQCETLVIGCSLDRMTPVYQQRRIQRKHKAQYLEISGAGHMVMLENKGQETINKILDWLYA
jgi:pimeloyl-ACP methyl ester carboxylesterase